MKKIFLSIASIAFASSSLFAQIPNNDFENWTSHGAYNNPDGWGTMNNATATGSVYTATKGTPGNTGASYLKLTSKTYSTGVQNGIAVSGVLDTLTMMPKSGFAFNLRPANFTGKWQHMIFGSSQGSILVTLTRWDAGSGMRVAVASASTTLSGMAMSWASFSLPFTYSDGGNPDTCIILLKASGNNPTNNDYLWVDGLAFTGSVTGIKTNTAELTSVSVFPNPAAETIHVNLNLKSARSLKIELADVMGKIILSKNTGIIEGQSTQSFDLKGIAKGNYFVNIITDKGAETRKIVVE